MPKGNKYQFFPPDTYLSISHLKRLIKIFTKLGVSKIRLTGGEALLRKDICTIIKTLKLIKGIKKIFLTTNGDLLEPLVEDLKRSGLDGLTVSLDALNETLFSKIRGTSKEAFHKVLKGIEASLKTGFEVKINTVILRHFNESEILPLVDYAREKGVFIRFIEFMDTGNLNHWNEKQVVSSSFIKKQIEVKYPLTPCKQTPRLKSSLRDSFSQGVAENYFFLDHFPGGVGFISSVTKPFCKNCNRARLSVQGILYTCLFAKKGFPLSEVLSKTDQQIEAYLREIWAHRFDRYSEERKRFLEKKSSEKKIEMFQIGG